MQLRFGPSEQQQQQQRRDKDFNDNISEDKQTIVKLFNKILGNTFRNLC